MLWECKSLLLPNAVASYCTPKLISMKSSRTSENNSQTYLNHLYNSFKQCFLFIQQLLHSYKLYLQIIPTIQPILHFYLFFYHTTMKLLKIILIYYDNLSNLLKSFEVLDMSRSIISLKLTEIF